MLCWLSGVFLLLRETQLKYNKVYLKLDSIYQHRIQTSFGTIWKIWALKKILLKKSLPTFFPCIIYAKTKWNNLRKLGSLFKQHKCGALRDLVPFVEFKKREKHPWRSVNFSKVAGHKCMECPLFLDGMPKNVRMRHC